MVHCSAYNCLADSRKRKGDEDAVAVPESGASREAVGIRPRQRKSFFRFPSDSALRKVWVAKLNLVNFKVKPHSRLCQDHFEENQFEIGPKRISSLGLTGIKRLSLKSDAVPTIFDKGSPKASGQVKGNKKFKRNPVKRLESRFKSHLSSNSPSPKKSRPKKYGAFVKRRRLEMISEILEEEKKKPYEYTPSDFVVSPLVLVETEDAVTEPIQNKQDKNKTPFVDKSTQLTTIADEMCVRKSYATQTPITWHFRGTQTNPRIWSRGTQTETHDTTLSIMVDQQTQTDNHQTNQTSITPVDEMDDESDEAPAGQSTMEDEDWIGTTEESDTEDSESSESEANLQEPKTYLVFESCIMSLFAICNICLAPCTNIRKTLCGSMLRIEAECIEGHKKVWYSQPMHKKMPWGNLRIAAACLFSGSQPSKVISFLKHLNMAGISKTVYNAIQSAYLIPSVFAVWEESQKKLFQKLQGKQLVLGGDARMDSPGYSAKYGSYSLMDLESNKIIDTQLIQSNEVGGAGFMELEGLKRALGKIEGEKIEYRALVTDRHGPVRKYMRLQKKDKQHYFDVFHVAKSIGKKVEKIGKKKGNGAILDWVKSIKNHVYWCAASSMGSTIEMKEKWLSLLNHVVNVHEGHGSSYKKCPHGKLVRNWLKKSQKGYKELKHVLTTKRLINDVAKLSPLEQTSALESFHNVIIRFAPKNTHFFYPCMKARIFLAVLHFNENSERSQALNKTSGERQWRVTFRKFKDGEGTVQQVKEGVSYEYVTALIKKAVELRRKQPNMLHAAKEASSSCDTPAFLSDKHKKMSKAEAIERHHTRFAKL